MSMALHWSDAVMDALSGRVLPVGLAATGPVPPSAERGLSSGGGHRPTTPPAASQAAAAEPGDKAGG